MNTTELSEAIVTMENAHDYLLENVNHLPVGAMRILSKLFSATLPLKLELYQHSVDVDVEVTKIKEIA